MNAYPRLFIAGVLVFQGASCAARATSTAQTRSPSLTPTASITAPRVTPTLATSSSPQPSVATGTPTVPLDARLSTECLQILPSPPDDLTSAGILVLNSQAEQGNGAVKHSTIFEDMATGAMTELVKPNQSLIFFQASPDGKKIAFDQGQFDASGNYLPRNLIDRQLVVAGADGKPLQSIPWDANWASIVSWLNNDELLIRLIVPEDKTQAEITSTFLVLNPATGARRILNPNFPDIYNVYYAPNWLGHGETAYDPTLSEVVYLRGGRDGSPTPTSYELWDLNSAQSVANFEVVAASGSGPRGADLESTPRWAPNGEHFAFALNHFGEPYDAEQWPGYELIVVGRDGQADRITHLTSYYPWLYISDLSWSPDASKIAFWFAPFKKQPDVDIPTALRLGVLDLATREVTDYCVPGDYAAQMAQSRSGSPPPPLWSPDGMQLVIQNRYAEGKSRVILVDPEKGIAAQIAEDMEPVGWMMAP